MNFFIKKSTFWGGLILLSLVVSCSKNDKSTEIPRAPDVNSMIPQPVVLEPPKEKPLYVYSGDRFRDPFIPAGQSTNYQPDAVFDPQRAVVKGIVYGSIYKSAILTVGGSGTYFVKGVRIFDVMGKNIEGFSAKILSDKVIVTGEADSVFELKIKTAEEEGKAL